MVCRQTEPNPHAEKWPLPLWAAFCIVSLTDYCLPGSSCSYDPHLCIKGISGCLLDVSVNHTTSSSRTLCSMMMIHHSWDVWDSPIGRPWHHLYLQLVRGWQQGCTVKQTLRPLGFDGCCWGVQHGLMWAEAKHQGVSWDIYQCVKRWARNYCWACLETVIRA